MLNELSEFLGCADGTYVIAEAGVNHNGCIKTALEMVKIAKGAGANAIKFQTFIPAELASFAAPLANYQKTNIADESSQIAMLSELVLSHDEHIEIMRRCGELGIDFLSSPFENQSADFLNSLDVCALKVGSGELTNLPFLGYLAKKNKPIILSTGMSNIDEVAEAVAEINAKGNSPIALLHCVSQYPAPIDEMNLLAIKTLKDVFKCPVGLSDHTVGFEAAVAAVALGATIIEKHFTLSRSMRGPDHAASLEPKELKNFIKCIRNVEKALGNGVKRQMPSEANTAIVARKSIVAGKFIPANSQLVASDLKIKRPAVGIKPSRFESILGKTTVKDINEDEPIQEHFLK